MNGKRSEPSQRLLNDVLQDEVGTERAKRCSLAAFRRGRLLRRVTIVSRLAAVVVVLAAGSFFFRAQFTKSRSLGQHAREVAGLPSKPRATGTAVSTPLPTLTDEELLASFPPDTCYLAEVEGRKVLVFADSSVRKKYLHCKGVTPHF